MKSADLSDRSASPRGLAIETSGRTGSLALVESGAVVAEDLFPHGLRHAAQIIARIDALCRSRGWGPRDLEEIYVSVGPGSFTGLRIGVTVAKALAFATGTRVYAASTVEVLARNAPPDWQNLVIALDAKRGEIFTARFARSADGAVEVEPAHLDRLSDMIERSPRPVHLLGEGLPFHQSAIPDDLGVIVTPPETWRARASAVAEVGQRRAELGLAIDPDALLPLYVRRPDAEEKWEQRVAAAPVAQDSPNDLP